MKTLSFTDFRKSLSEHLNSVEDDCEEIIIARDKGRKAIVLSYDDYLSLKETAYLLSSDKNLRHLNESIKQAEEGQVTELVI